MFERLMGWYTELTDRLDRIEARQYASGHHDPTCPVFMTEKKQQSTGMYLTVPDCDCWLSKPLEPTPHPEGP